MVVKVTVNEKNKRMVSLKIWSVISECVMLNKYMNTLSFNLPENTTYDKTQQHIGLKTICCFSAQRELSHLL